jgi:hypothetical protein
MVSRVASIELPADVTYTRIPMKKPVDCAEQFLLAATAQNLKRLVRFLAQRELKNAVQPEK